MQNSFSYITKWLISLGRELAHVTPTTTFASVVASLVAQVSLLISFLLPLKIIMLMSAQRLPDFLSSELKSISLETIIIFLVALTLMFYLIQLFANKASGILSQAGATKLLQNTNKVLLFENQVEVANNAYKQFTELLSGLTFCSLSLAILFWLYPALASVIVLCVCAAISLNMLLSRFRGPFNKLSQSELAFKINGSVGAGFFIVFVWIVIDYLYFTPPNFIIVLGSFILSRQLIANLGNVVRQTLSLIRNDEKITALFFHHHVLKDTGAQNSSPLWELIQNDRSFNWIKVLFNECTGSNVSDFSSYWLDTGFKNIAIFGVNVGETEQRLLIKVFDKSALSQATHEECLLQDISSPESIAPPLLLTKTIAGVKCHVYDVTNITTQNQIELWSSELDTLEVLLRIRPSDELKTQYSRSKQTLPERFGVIRLEQLQQVSSLAEQQSIAQFVNQFDQLSAILKCLPLWVIPPHYSQIMAIKSDETELKIIHWGKWELEPVGACWPVNHDKLESIEAAVNRASEYRPELTSYPIEFYQLASLTYALESELVRLRFNKALILIRRINTILEQQQFSLPSSKTHYLTHNHIQNY